MITDNLKYQIERQIRFQTPEGYYHITTKQSKDSYYFYVGTEKELDDFELGKEFKDNELLKFRVSNHDAICGNSWSHRGVVLEYYNKDGYTIDNEHYTQDECQIAKLIVNEFVTYFKKNECINY
jgi:hypothetical protein